jgi:hypothetical protein
MTGPNCSNNPLVHLPYCKQREESTRAEANRAEAEANRAADTASRSGA